MEVSHHHHVAGMAKNAAEAFDVAPVAQVLGSEGVAELVVVDLEPHSQLDSLQQIPDRHHPDRLPVSPHEQAVGLRLDPMAIHVAVDFPPQPGGYGDAAKLGSLALANLQKTDVAVALVVLDSERGELTDAQHLANVSL